MEQVKVEKLTALVNDLIAAGSCCAEAREAGRKWLDAVGTDGEAAATEALIAELKEDIITIDGLIGFLQSPKAQEIFGAEGAAAALERAKQRKADGAQWCDCPACAACEAILTELGAL